MRVVKHKLTGAIVYRQDPDFEWGLGIKNTVALEGGKEDDYEELEINEAQWAAWIDSQPKPRDLAQEIDEIKTKIDAMRGGRSL